MTYPDIPEKISGPEALELLKQLKSGSHDDREVAHCAADDVLCSLLRNLGYSDVVVAFNAIDKWYA